MSVRDLEGRAWVWLWQPRTEPPPRSLTPACLEILPRRRPGAGARAGWTMAHVEARHAYREGGGHSHHHAKRLQHHIQLIVVGVDRQFRLGTAPGDARAAAACVVAGSAG